ncbi:DUF7109 family protein [Halorientalis halophila]|uniref:DUF7109 family protein n=1 Tax=Halorientalis halophila TaxID=3108499 RepID=UPI00300B475E
MDVTGDELAGVVDLFDALTSTELRRALAELAYRCGEEVEPEYFDGDVAAALATYHLVAVEPADAEEPLLVAGPVAFPELPGDATDLPHMLDVPDRSVDRADLATAAENRFRADAEKAIDAGDEERIRELLDVSYELEVWAPVDVGETRQRLDDALA